MPDYPPQWDEIVTCILCGHTSRAQWKRSGYRPGTWLCLCRRACRKRQHARSRRELYQRLNSRAHCR